jgi:hypothetical protein
VFQFNILLILKLLYKSISNFFIGIHKKNLKVYFTYFINQQKGKNK